MRNYDVHRLKVSNSSAWFSMLEKENWRITSPISGSTEVNPRYKAYENYIYLNK